MNADTRLIFRIIIGLGKNESRHAINHDAKLTWHLCRWAEDPKSSPFFDGSDTSMSGDGFYIPGRNYSCFPFEDPCFMKLQPGSGGGCVTSGPFKE